jgi:hypothetical protein
MVSKFRGRNFFKGVECNIPPVSIGILPVDRARGLMLSKVSMENIYYVISVYYGLSISVRFNTLEARAYW